MTDNSTLNDLVGYHLRRASVFDLAGAVAALNPVGTRPITMSVLTCIVEQPGITSAEICRLLGMQRANIVQFLADLDAKAFLLRKADASDQRIQRLYPTDAGLAAAKDWLARLSAHEDAMLHRLTPDERKELCRLLGLIWMPSPDAT